MRIRVRVRASAHARLRALGRDTPYLEVRYAVSLVEIRRISFGTPCGFLLKGRGEDEANEPKVC